MKERQSQVSTSTLVKIHLTQVLELCAGIPLSLVVWPMLLATWTVSKFVRWVVEVYLNWVSQESYSMAQGTDSLFGYKVQNDCNSIMQAYAVIKGKFDVNYIRKRISNLVEGNPKFKKRFLRTMGFYTWSTCGKDFKIENHIKVMRHPENREWTNEDLYSVLETLSDKPMDDSKPMWEFLLFPNYRHHAKRSTNDVGEKDQDSTEYFAQITRFHHSYGDGISFFLSLSKYLFDEPVELPIDPKDSFPVPRALMFLQYVKVVLLGPFYFCRFTVQSILSHSKFSTKQYSERKYMCRSVVPIPLATLKAIKNKAKASVTAILISCITSQLQKYHEETFPDTPLPEKLTLGNVSAMLPYKDDQVTNRFTIFPLNAPLGEKDRRKRLKKTNEEGFRVAMSPDPFYSYIVMQVVGELPCALQNVLISTSTIGSPILLSNITGFAGDIRVYQGRVVDYGAWFPLIATTGIGIASNTYCGEVRFCGMADSSVISREGLQKILDGIPKEVESLKKLYLEQKDVIKQL